MSTSMAYGGWSADDLIPTGSSISQPSAYQGESCNRTSTAVNILTSTVIWLGIVVGATCTVGTGGKLSVQQQQQQLQRGTKQTQYMASTAENIDEPLGRDRTPADNLARIREVLKPAVSDLASTLGVSRQSVYNWINGETIADGNAAKLQNLAEAADLLALEGVTVNAALLRRKFANGRTLIQVAQAGESAKEAARQLAHIYKQEAAQYKRMESRFATRARTAPTADFDLPSADDHA